MIDLRFEPQKVQITQQEIMDDLRYPVASKRRAGAAEAAHVRSSAGASTG